MYIFVGHSFVRKWMLLTNPGDKGADEEQAVSNREKAHWKLDINKKYRPCNCYFERTDKICKLMTIKNRGNSTSTGTRDVKPKRLPPPQPHHGW